MNQEILNYSNKQKENYDKVLKLINKYNKICVFRHRVPDFDALGTQLGLYYFLKDNFPTKDIICVGDDHNKFTPKLYEKMQIIPDEWFDDEFLSIVVDVSDKSRVSDERFIKAKEIVVFDHHPYVKDYDCLAIIDTEIAAASELVADFMIYSNLKISEKSAYYLYSGLVGDSGRFLYSSTNQHTFAIAEELIDKKIDINKIYSLMYEQEINDLNILRYIHKAKN